MTQINVFKRFKEFIYPDKQHKRITNEWDGTDDKNDRTPFNVFTHL